MLHDCPQKLTTVVGGILLSRRGSKRSLIEAAIAMIADYRWSRLKGLGVV